MAHSNAKTHRPPLAPAADYSGPKRALILAGGGMRVAYHAGVLRAFEEAGLCFSHVDGTSGGIINTGMVLSGLLTIGLRDSSPNRCLCDSFRSITASRGDQPWPANTRVVEHLPRVG